MVTWSYPKQTDPWPPRETLPTMYDLPSEDPDEPGLPDEFHDLQPQLLSATFRLSDYSRDQIFTGTDINLYYDVNHPLWHKRPDWFGVVGVPRLYNQQDLRLSYVIWQEGVIPSVVVELLSPGTEKEDLGETMSEPDRPPSKWQVYEQILQVPYYIVFDRYSDRLRAFHLAEGRYRELPLSEPRIWMADLKLGLGLWDGSFDGITRQWLRWYDETGNWVLTTAEREALRAEQERRRAQEQQQRAEQERRRAQEQQQRAEQERQRAETAEARVYEIVSKLFQMNMAIEQIAQVTGLTIAEVEQLSAGRLTDADETTG